jgi:uncharacterized protein (DUF924 family)
MSAEEHRQFARWWMRGEANAEMQAFKGTLAEAKAHRLDEWARLPQGRLSLILLLDQFTRGLFAGTPDACASDLESVQLVEEGLANGHFDALATPWEQSFFLLPLVHAEGIAHVQRLDRAIALTEQRASEWPVQFLPLYRDFGLKQMRGHRDTIIRFGRFPHRNAILKRTSTPEEIEYLLTGGYVV